jgi:RNA polymerase-binding transcription factor DksA
MAKSAKKSSSKPVKKSVAKGASTKKAVTKAKPKPAKPSKPTAKKAVKPAPEKVKNISKKAIPEKKASVKKVELKKAEPKVEAKKVVIEKKTPEPKPKKVAKEKVVKQEEPIGLSTPASRKQEAMALPKTSPQLTMFQIPTVRPIAHKPAQASSNSQDKTRYSEEELKEFETLIKSKLEKANEEFKILKGTLNRTDDAGTDATSGGNTKVLEDGAETAEKENLSQLAARQLKYITNLENALVRIKNGTYGICSVTGKLISKERLIAVPHTTQSIEAKMMSRD